MLDKESDAKINEMKQNGEPMGCLTCMGFLDDGKHEYDKQNDIFYCPAMEE